MKKWILTLALFLPFLACAQEQEKEKYVTTPEDRALAGKVLAELKARPDEAPGAQMVRAAEVLLGQPYVAGTLEELPEEQLCIYLTRTDCILFVETCLGLVRTASCSWRLVLDWCGRHGRTEISRRWPRNCGRAGTGTAYVPAMRTGCTTRPNGPGREFPAGYWRT